MRVYGWQGHRRECPPAPNGGRQTREIVAAATKAAAARAAGALSPAGRADPRQMWNLCEAGNARELATARAEPGCVFWAPMDDRSGRMVRDGEEWPKALRGLDRP